MTERKSIISVGYSLDLEPVKERLFEILELTDRENLNFATKPFSGVWYSISCRGGLTDVKKYDDELVAWYNARINKEHKFNITKLHVNTKKTLLVGEIHSIDRFYAFLYNKNGVSTTCQKKRISNNQPGWTTVNLTHPLIISAQPYID